MGRRSKIGKNTNPADQARKEDRKKELKKNKKKRQIARVNVLKEKDPGQILKEMEQIDEMEYNVYQPSSLNENVLSEKRRKLKGTFNQLMRLYYNDDPELWTELKRKEFEYENSRLKKQQYSESVKRAQTVQVDEIPLPPAAASAQFPNQGRIPISFSFGPAASTTKPEENTTESKKKKPPGCPPGPPPDLLKMKELDSDYEDEDLQEAKKYKSIQFSDDIMKPIFQEHKILPITYQNVNDFMKEMENIQKEQEKDSDSGKQSNEEGDESDDDSNIKKEDNDDEKTSDQDESHDKEEEKRANDMESEKKVQEPQISLPRTYSSIFTSGLPLPSPIGFSSAMMISSPTLHSVIPGLAIRMPPGPPPGRPVITRLGIRMPPGPPPGLPRSQLMNHHNQKNQSNRDSKGVTTITAKPQIRNLISEVTQFVPSTLRVKREDKVKPRLRPYHQEFKQIKTNKGVTKDDAYMQFMREMQELL